MSVNTFERLQSCSPSEGSIESTVKTLIEIVEEQSERIDELETELHDHREESAKSRAETRRRVTDIEERDDTDARGEGNSDDTNPTPDDDQSASQTALVDVCRLPNDVAERELSANQRRARFVAKDIADYATSVPAGYAITSSEIATVLRAGTDCKGRSQTTARVMDFLDRLGESAVKVVKRRGTRRVILDEELVERLERVEDTDAVESDNTRRYHTTVPAP